MVRRAVLKEIGFLHSGADAGTDPAQQLFCFYSRLSTFVQQRSDPP